MQKTSITSIVPGLVALFATPAVFAHGGIHMDLGVIDGFMHPASGFDHLLVAIAAGFWAARRGNHGLRDMSFVLALFAGRFVTGRRQPELATAESCSAGCFPAGRKCSGGGDCQAAIICPYPVWRVSGLPGPDPHD